MTGLPAAAVDVEALAARLYSALGRRAVIEPLTDLHPGLSLEDAYAISKRMLDYRLAAGERLVGKKIGVTSEAVQRMLGVHQPDFGFLTDAMQVAEGEAAPISASLIQPRAEAEIAFRMGRTLSGPGVGPVDVARAVERVLPCVEIVDSRIRDWRIRIADTVADNASCGLFVVGAGVAPMELDLAAVRCTMRRNGRIVGTGAGSAVQGSPYASVAWLANTLGAFGIRLEAGDIVLSGSLVPLEPVFAGDFVETEIEGVGRLAVRFT
jgi:2-oxopent-4-enoate/cis-2-oxohex-4-enoate hydratase